MDNVSSSSRDLVTGFPQGSVLGPFMYPVYTSPLFEIASRHGLQIHMYADDTQVYLSFSVHEENQAVELVQDCLAEIRQWMFRNHLKLNDSKTEFLIIGNQQMTKQLNGVNHIVIGDSSVTAVDHAKNIGVILDSQLDMTKHVNETCKTCYMHIHNISKIRNKLNEEATATLINALVTSRLDYANAILYGIPDCLLKKLEAVQKSAARLVFKKKKSCNADLLLEKLHWLPVKYRIEYKINLLTFKCIHNMAPKYLIDLVNPYTPALNLRSSKQGKLLEKGARLHKTDRTFSCAAPSLWNDLPIEIRSVEDLCAFKRVLKTHYFRIAFT